MQRSVIFCVSLLLQVQVVAGTGGSTNTLWDTRKPSQVPEVPEREFSSAGLCRVISQSSRCSLRQVTTLLRPARSAVTYWELGTPRGDPLSWLETRCKDPLMSASYYEIPVSTGEAKMKCKWKSSSQNSQRKYKCLQKKATGELMIIYLC